MAAAPIRHGDGGWARATLEIRNGAFPLAQLVAGLPFFRGETPGSPTAPSLHTESHVSCERSRLWRRIRPSFLASPSLPRGRAALRRRIVLLFARRVVYALEM